MEGRLNILLFPILFFCIPIHLFGQTISAGDEFSVSICSDSTIKSWGDNDNGELGIGYKSIGGCHCDSLPVNMLSMTGMVAVAAGVDFGLALKSDGTVWSWGWEYTGSTGSLMKRYTPLQVAGISNVKKIAVGYGHSLAIKDDGTVWTWGQNLYGELGHGTVSTTGCFCDTVPTQVSGLTGMIDIAGGYSFSLALKNDGTVWSWGRNVGTLGDSTNTERHSPIKVNGVSGITAIASGAWHSLALKNDGTIWAWGLNNYKELGDSTNINRNYPVHSKGIAGVKAIAGGAYYTLALKMDGTVWSYGYNYSGQGGNGLVSMTGCMCDSVPVQVSLVSGVVAIAAATVGAHSLALKNDGTVWSWGSNRTGQLGFGDVNAFSMTNLPCGCDSLPGQVLSLCSVLGGVNELNDESSVNVYPNPFASQTTISFQSEQKHTSIKIIDVIGKELKNIHFSGASEYTIDKGEMHPGIYFLRIEDDEKNIVTKKIILQ